MLQDNSIDALVCCGMLHHLDLSFAFPELRRILKPGGKTLAIEALDYNPVIKFYRYLTPDMRTEWEKAHILSLKDVRFASRFFKVNRKDYWHVVGYAAGKFPFLTVPLEFIDKILEKIYQHQARLDLTCRFRWTENAVAIWDNRSVQHYAISDFFPGRGLGYERIMDRIAIEGDRPN